MSPIKGKIARREYDEAIEELNELLEGKPFSPEPYSILVEVYANELNDYSHAMELIEEYFNQEKVYCFDENIDMLLLYADICQERNYLKKAEALLAREAARKSYPEIKRKALETRLEAIAS
jgi:energy-converting hydrogenase A subunit M